MVAVSSNIPQGLIINTEFLNDYEYFYFLKFVEIVFKLDKILLITLSVTISITAIINCYYYYY